MKRVSIKYFTTLRGPLLEYRSHYDAQIQYALFYPNMILGGLLVPFNHDTLNKEPAITFLSWRQQCGSLPAQDRTNCDTSVVTTDKPIVHTSM